MNCEIPLIIPWMLFVVAIGLIFVGYGYGRAHAYFRQAQGKD